MTESIQNLQYKKMIETPIPRLIPKMAVPTIISMMVTAIYNAADTYFVAMLGTQAAAAVGVVFSLMSLIQTCGFTIGIGSGSQISRLLGQKRQEEAEETTSSALLEGILLGFLILILGFCFLTPLMRLLGATETTLEMSKAYARYILLASPIMMGSFVLNNNLRSEGKAVFSMVGITTGVIINVILDPVFIFGMKMGIAGAALATGISQTISFLILISHYIRKVTVVHIHWGAVSKKASTYLRIIKFGLPSFFRQGLGTVAIVIMNVVAGGMGDAPLAAISIVSKITFLFGAMIVGFGQGFQPVAGYNYGAKRYDRVKKAILFSLVVTIGLMLIFGLGCAAKSTEVMKLFSSDPEVIEIGAKCLWSQCIVFPLVPFIILCNMVFQAIGRTSVASFTSSLRQGIYFIPLMLVMPRIWGVDGVAYAQAVADLLSSVTCMPIYVILFITLNKLEKMEEENKNERFT